MRPRSSVQHVGPAPMFPPPPAEPAGWVSTRQACVGKHRDTPPARDARGLPGAGSLGGTSPGSATLTAGCRRPGALPRPWCGRGVCPGCLGTGNAAWLTTPGLIRGRAQQRRATQSRDMASSGRCPPRPNLAKQGSTLHPNRGSGRCRHDTEFTQTFPDTTSTQSRESSACDSSSRRTFVPEAAQGPINRSLISTTGSGRLTRCRALVLVDRERRKHGDDQPTPEN